eukprot:CAMPEP_0176087310 /NCGR_PEP_ID=MMETSP0120_2-20121206/43710_1 /TAXON_ID=160619 /ORGANISM="Kryptoperidinium foliaceum, Strain CCMP 1326" /LENGTH=165 /DNA_ID=CAMNT_0017421153 /DNA_START=174 /DNA_END=669 /DNA_ORIENTATION=+
MPARRAALRALSMQRRRRLRQGASRTHGQGVDGIFRQPRKMHGEPIGDATCRRCPQSIGPHDIVFCEHAQELSGTADDCGRGPVVKRDAVHDVGERGPRSADDRPASAHELADFSGGRRVDSAKVRFVADEATTLIRRRSGVAAATGAPKSGSVVSGRFKMRVCS